jgi:hypothetical protein
MKWDKRAEEFGKAVPTLVFEKDGEKNVARGLKGCIDFIDKTFGVQSLFPTLKKLSTKNSIELCEYFCTELWPWDFHCMLLY